MNPTEIHRAAVYELARHLVMKKGYEITILQPSGRSRPKRKNSSGNIRNDIKVENLPSLFIQKFYYTMPLIHEQLRLLRELVDKMGSQIIQTCEYSYLTSIAPIFMKKRNNIPIVLTSSSLPGYSWFYGHAIVDTIAKAYTYSVGKWILNSYDRIVLLHEKASRAVENFGVPAEHIFTIPNGVDSESFRFVPGVDETRTELSIGNDKVLLFVGRLAKVKRVEILIALTNALLEEGLDVKTIIVGDGPCKAYYEKLAEPINKSVIFTGWLHRTQTFKFYQIADVFVLPSLSEGLPTVLLEASAAGKPSVASNVSGVSDIVIHGETGYLVRKFDIDSYKTYVKNLLEDDDLARKMGARASEYVKENFNWDVVVDKYEKLYQGIL